MDRKYLEELRDVIRKLHGTEATHVETVPIKEEFQGRQFGKAKLKSLTCTIILRRIACMRGRMRQKMQTTRDAHVTVLHIPPATSPRKAVQASIVSEYREKKGRAES